MPAASVQRTVAVIALALLLCVVGASRPASAQTQTCDDTEDASPTSDECDPAADAVSTDNDASADAVDRSISTLRGPESITATPTEAPPALGFGVSPQFAAPESDPPQAVATSPVADPAPLAKSGSESLGLIIIGMGLISAGSAVIAITRRFTPNR